MIRYRETPRFKLLASSNGLEPWGRGWSKSPNDGRERSTRLELITDSGESSA